MFSTSLQIALSRLLRIGLFSAVLLTVAVAGLPLSRILAQDPTPTTSPAPQPTFSNVPITVTIGGRVSSGTAGIPVSAGLPITLQIAHPDPKTGAPTQAVKRDVAAGADGTFTFDQVLATPGDVVILTTVFEGVTQVSTPLQLQNEQTKLEIPMTLYAATNDLSVINLVRAQHILTFDGGVMQVLATYDYKNNSDRLYLSNTKTAVGQPTSVNIPLPVGARAIAFNAQNSLRYSIGGDVNAPIVYDTKPVAPGQVHEVVLSYQLPYASGTPIDQDYPYATTLLQVLIPTDSGVVLTAPRLGLATMPPDQVQVAANNLINPTRVYTEYTFTNPLKAGDRVVYTLNSNNTATPTKQTAPITQQAESGRLILIGVLFLATILVVLGGVIVRQTFSKKR